MDKTMADKLMNISNDDKQKFLRLLSQQIRKRHYGTLETSVLNSPMFPSSLHPSAKIKATNIIDCYTVGQITLHKKQEG